MAFTAGSTELAKANALGLELAHLLSVYTGAGMGLTGANGAAIIEKYARKMGFGITGLTTGANFPPFGTATSTLGIAASLQNPRGETLPGPAGGLTAIGAFEGNTLGIYRKKFARDGADYIGPTTTGVTLAFGYTSGSGNTLTAVGPVNVHIGDRIVFPDATYIVTGNMAGGATSGAQGVCAAFRVLGTVSTYATGAPFNIVRVGITRGTVGIFGSTFENFTGNNAVVGGQTAAIWFAAPTGGSGTWIVS